MADAFVLAGAVAKGAFGAGVLSVLTDPTTARAIGLDVARVVGVSSGALNAAYLAHAIHAGTLDGSGDRLARIWIEEARAARVFDPSLRGIAQLRGALAEDKVLGILRGAIPPTPAAHPVDLRIVVTNLAGDVRQVGGRPATTFEHVAHFDGGAFERADRLESLFAVVAASAAFPGAFVPVTLRIGGREVSAVDGGAVNNAPLRQAIDRAPRVDRVWVVTPFPRVYGDTPPRGGLAYVSHLADVLVEERLFRDLRDAYDQNRALARLAALPIDVRRDVLDALGWSGRREIAIVEVRPRDNLEGDAFRGFFSRRLREDYVAAGRDAARAALASLTP